MKKLSVPEQVAVLHFVTPRVNPKRSFQGIPWLWPLAPL
jgi:hypothetical protein